MRQTGMAESGFELRIEVALIAADQCENETGGLTAKVSVQEFPQRIARRFFFRLRARPKVIRNSPSNGAVDAFGMLI